jgi:hypothetical protein
MVAVGWFALCVPVGVALGVGIRRAREIAGASADAPCRFRFPASPPAVATR